MINKHDYIRTATRPFVYALVTNNKYCQKGNINYIECENILKKYALADKPYKADGTFHIPENEAIFIGHSTWFEDENN